MLLVIFGAGASFDSARFPRAETAEEIGLINRMHENRPPLAKDLVARRFGRVAADLPASRPVIDRLRLRMGTDPTASLETELARLIDESGNSAERRQQLVAFRFYLHRVIQETITEWISMTDGFTHYLTLLNRIYDWHKQTGTPVRLATFNYDVLLDRAAQDVVTGWHFIGQLPKYVERTDFRLFKLHGSTDWSRVLQTDTAPGTSALGAAMALAGVDRVRGGEIMAVYPELEVGARFGPSAASLGIPAMAIPMAAKTDFECPGYHIEALRRDLPQVTHLLIVGWRAAEPHAVALLEGSEPREGIFPGYALGLVTGNDKDAKEVESNLGAVWRKGKLRVHATDGFSAFIENLDEHLESLLAPVH